MKVARRTRLRDHAALFGWAFHSGLPVTLTIHPADAEDRTGRRSSDTRSKVMAGRDPATMPGRSDCHRNSLPSSGINRRTTGSTAEHVLASLRGPRRR